MLPLGLRHPPRSVVSLSPLMLREQAKYAACSARLTVGREVKKSQNAQARLLALTR